MSKARSVFLFWSRLTLLFVFLVIIAGSVVRATGSGMGCPDWPKCFGHYIPPTELAQLEFQPDKEFKKGQFIIHQRALWKAKQSFTTGDSINLGNWQKYTKHDYAKFNAAHTWTEYINRLCGAILGIVSFIALLVSFRLWREQKSLPLLSLLAVFLIGFEAWLGATVVESNLEPAKITTHMVGAVVIVAVVLEMIRRARRGTASSQPAASGKALKVLLPLAILATVVQIILGTQVREGVDTLDKAMDGAGRDLWVEQIGTSFQIHRAFAYLLILLNAYIIYRLRKNGAGASVQKLGYAILALFSLEWLSGVLLALLGLPAIIQPVHLVLAVIIFALQVRLWQAYLPDLPATPVPPDKLESATPAPSGAGA